MAELGIAAAVLQIVQLAGVVALKTNSISGKLRHAPQVIKGHLHSVNDFTCTLRALEHALEVESVDQPCLRHILCDESLSSIEELLQRCDEEASACDAILQAVAPQGGTKFREVLKRISSIQKEEDISQRLKTLDSLKSQLSIWYSHQLMLLTCRTHLGLTNLDSRIESLNLEVHRGLSIREPSTLAVEKLANEFCHRLASRPSQLAGLAGDESKRKRSCNLVCRCRQVLQSARGSNYGFIRYQNRTAESHQPGCPFFGQRLASRVERSLRCSLISWSIEITMARPSCLGPTMLFGLNVISTVDDLTAPSFERFRDAARKISRTLKRSDCQTLLSIFGGLIMAQSLSSVKQTMHDLLDALADDLQNGRYSARDQSRDGSTLLHVSSRCCLVLPILKLIGWKRCMRSFWW